MEPATSIAFGYLNMLEPVQFVVLFPFCIGVHQYAAIESAARDGIRSDCWNSRRIAKSKCDGEVFKARFGSYNLQLSEVVGCTLIYVIVH